MRKSEPSPGQRRTRTTFRLRDDILDGMKAAADRHARSVSNLTESLMLEFLRKERRAARAERNDGA